MKSFNVLNLVMKRLFPLEKTRKLIKKGGEVVITAVGSEIFSKKISGGSTYSIFPLSQNLWSVNMAGC